VIDLATVLYFESEDVVRIVKVPVKDGRIRIGDKDFIVDNFKAKLLKTAFGYQPIYMLKWNDVYPAKNFNPIFEEKIRHISPEALNRFIDLKILANLISARKEGFQAKGLVMMFLVLIIIFGLVIGILPMFGIKLF
jgi:hypothetical protein